MIVIAIIAIWLLGSLFGYGFCLGHFAHRYPWSNSTRQAIGFGLFFGPFGAILGGLFGQFRLRFRPQTTEECWEAHHREWPNLDREYFNSKQ